MSKSDAPVVVAETTTPSVSTGDHYNVWFGVRGDDLGLIAGVYVAHIIYTATINPAVPANVERVESNAYNLGDTTKSANATIYGANLTSVDEVCLVPVGDAADCSALPALNISNRLYDQVNV